MIVTGSAVDDRRSAFASGGKVVIPRAAEDRRGRDDAHPCAIVARAHVRRRCDGRALDAGGVQRASDLSGAEGAEADRCTSVRDAYARIIDRAERRDARPAHLEVVRLAGGGREREDAVGISTQRPCLSGGSERQRRHEGARAEKEWSHGPTLVAARGAAKLVERIEMLNKFRCSLKASDLRTTKAPRQQGFREARPAGIEPATSRSGGERSIR